MMNKSELQCWKCGQALEDLILPLSRRDTCRTCGAELHVCRMCKHYDSRVAGRCREERAEDVADKERANFCDFFSPRAGAHDQRTTVKSEGAKQELDALFGNSDEVDEESEELPFDDTAAEEQPLSKEEQAKKKLDDLFN